MKDFPHQIVRASNDNFFVLPRAGEQCPIPTRIKIEDCGMVQGIVRNAQLSEGS